jgi:hypothetical protein
MMFDVKELEKIQSDVCEAEYARLMRVGEWTVDEADAMAQHAAILAVAAYVRSATLREAAGVCEAVRDQWSYYEYEPSERKGATMCIIELNKLAASARETGGKPTLEQSAARLHEKYGDALAKMDDAAPGERDGGKC